MSAPATLLYLHTGGAELWGRRGRRITRLAALPYDEDFTIALANLLRRTGAARLDLLLNLPSLSLRQEKLPGQVSRLDRAKLALRRLTFLSPQAGLRGVRFLNNSVAQLATLARAPQLTAALAAIATAHVRLGRCSHAALEVASLLRTSAAVPNGILVLKLDASSGLLLAHEGHTVVAARTLTAERLAPALLSAEVDATLTYMLRHSWPPQAAVQLRMLGLPALPDRYFARQLAEPQVNAKAELLAQLFNPGRPCFSLDHPRLAKRRHLQQLSDTIRRLASATLLLVLGTALATQVLTRALDQRTATIIQLAAPMPPAGPLPSRSTLENLQRQQAAADSVGNAEPGAAAFAYRASDGEVTLRVTASEEPSLPGWQLQRTATPPASGRLDEATGPAPAQSYQLRYSGDRP